MYSALGWTSLAQDQTFLDIGAQIAAPLNAVSPAAYIEMNSFGAVNNLTDWKTRLYGNYTLLLQVRCTALLRSLILSAL